MAIRTKKQPEWYSLSHRDRYRKLNRVGREWWQRPSGENKDRRGLTAHLDGTWINDVASFYLSLGEAVNGPGGYFGAGLDALSDCFCGGFGVLPPLTVRLSRFDDVQSALDARAWFRFRAESFREAAAASADHLVDWGYLGDGSPDDITRWTAAYEAALAGEPFDCGDLGSYFDAILEVFEDAGAALIPENEDTSQ